MLAYVQGINAGAGTQSVMHAYLGGGIDACAGTQERPDHLRLPSFRHQVQGGVPALRRQHAG
jgi:hypothetical protein